MGARGSSGCTAARVRIGSMLLLVVLACFEPAECRAAKESATTAWTLAADATEAQGRGAHAQAQAGVERAKAVDEQAASVTAATPPKTPAARQAQDAYTRAMATGGDAGDAAYAANRAELSVKLRNEGAALETAARQADALAARLSAWSGIEVAWREAGGLARAGAIARKVAKGELPPGTDVPFERLPVQVGNTRSLPESPIDLEPLAAGAAAAHAAFTRAAEGAGAAIAAVQEGDYRVKALLSYLQAEQIPAEGEVLSASNEVRLAMKHGEAAVTAIQAATAPPRDDTLTQGPEVAAARAATERVKATCK